MTDFRLAPDHDVVFFTGAGMSVASGVPTYRGKGGVWEEYDYERYACQQAFDRSPETVWEFHNVRREAVGACEPNRGHEIVAALENELANVTIVTQNIDGLHQRAGSSDPIELHGSLWRVRCDVCGRKKEAFEVPFQPIECECGKGHWRPDIIWFGDPLNGEAIEAATNAIRTCDVFVSIGTSAVVFPAAALPLEAPDDAVRVEINPERTRLSGAYDHCMRCTAIDGLETLAEHVLD